MFETRGDDIERKICPEPETSMPDEQMNDNCDEAVSPEKDKNEPVIDLGTDSDKNSANDPRTKTLRTKTWLLIKITTKAQKYNVGMNSRASGFLTVMQ